MLNVSKLLFFMIMLFNLSMPLHGMLANLEKIKTSTDMTELKALLEADSFAAPAALNQMRDDNSVSREKVDLLIKYSDKDVLAHYLSFPQDPSQEDTYVTQQMRKKVEEESCTHYEIGDQQPTKIDGKSKKLANKVKNHFTRKKNHKKSRAGIPVIQHDDKNKQEQDSVESIAHNPENILRQSEGTTEIKSPVLEAESIEKTNSEPLTLSEDHKTKNSQIFTYIKWVGVCAGLAFLVYYLHAHTNKKMVSHL